MTDDRERHRDGRYADASIAVRALAASPLNAPSCPSGRVDRPIDVRTAFDLLAKR